MSKKRKQPDLNSLLGFASQFPKANRATFGKSLIASDILNTVASAVGFKAGSTASLAEMQRGIESAVNGLQPSSHFWQMLEGAEAAERQLRSAGVFEVASGAAFARQLRLADSFRSTPLNPSIRSSLGLAGLADEPRRILRDASLKSSLGLAGTRSVTRGSLSESFRMAKDAASVLRASPGFSEVFGSSIMHRSSISDWAYTDYGKYVRSRDQIGAGFSALAALRKGTETKPLSVLIRDENVTIDDEEFSKEEIEEVIEAAVDVADPERGAGSVNDLVELINTKFEESEKKADARSRRSIVTTIVFAILFELLVWLLSHQPEIRHFQNSIISGTRGINKDVQSHIIKQRIGGFKEFYREFYNLKEYRVVTCESMSLRMKPTRKSRIVGTLVLGDSVRLIRKKRPWTNVEVHHGDFDKTVTGWCYLRYLKRIR